ncbi:MAG TPA: TIGR03560 family F420-dependent LLM class oxidoreductase [Dehalococcoidia bacterium]|nr:TIGR03560 family F420-dependent LLM class oxidoreductase [Dehalococcoidia bacterium]
MKLGVMIESQEGVGWTEWKNIVQWTEELGFESLWRSDHFFSFFGPSRTIDSLDTMIAHSYTASHSQRIRFGPLVLSMTFRHPAVLARMAAAVDQLSNGRFILGVGAGWNQTEHDAYGIELPSIKDRMDNLEESIKVIKALFENDAASFEGKKYRLQDAPMSPKPAQKPMSLLIGGSGEQRTLRMVARYATEWNTPGGPVETYRHKVAVLEQHCEKEKRDPKSIDRSLMASYILGENQADIDRQVEAILERMPPRFRPADGSRRLPMGAMAGTTPQLIEQIKAWEAEGVSRIMLQYHRPPTREMLQTVAQEILPKV